MSSVPEQPDYSEQVQQQLEDLARRLRLAHSVDQIWHRLLSNEERQRVEASDTIGPDIIDIWTALREMSPGRAVADLAHRMELVGDNEHQWLLDDLGEQSTPDQHPLLPVWNRDRGELAYDGEVVRHIRSTTIARNVVLLLDCFHEDGWPDRIDDPLPGPSDPQRLREAVRALNRNLRRIRFCSDGTGTGVTWEVA